MNRYLAYTLGGILLVLVFASIFEPSTPRVFAEWAFSILMLALDHVIRGVVIPLLPIVLTIWFFWIVIKKIAGGKK